MKTENFEKLVFFWQRCSREMASSLLKNKSGFLKHHFYQVKLSDGTFLLRHSSDDFICLSFKHKEVFHEKIKGRLDGSILIGQENLFPSERYLLEEMENLKIRLRFFDENSSQVENFKDPKIARIDQTRTKILINPH